MWKPRSITIALALLVATVVGACNQDGGAAPASTPLAHRPPAADPAEQAKKEKSFEQELRDCDARPPAEGKARWYRCKVLKDWKRRADEAAKTP